MGAQVICTPAQRQRLLAELAAQARFQLILAPEQRQQLLALQLLAAQAPFILSQLQDAFAVARATVLKNLDALAPWLATPPAIREQNLLGAGDSMLAGLVWGLARGEGPAALRWGVACGAATASRAGTAVGDAAQVAELAALVQIQEPALA